MRYSLTEETAGEDAALLINALAKVCASFLRALAASFEKPTVSCERPAKADAFVNNASEIDIFFRVLQSVGLTPNSQLPGNVIPGVKDAIGVAVKKMYAHANGEAQFNDLTITYTFANGENVIAYVDDIIMSCYYILAGHFIKIVKPLTSYNDLFEEYISPRFAYAWRNYDARSSFEATFNSARAQGKLQVSDEDIEDNVILSITPSDIAIICDVAYSYIIKLIKMDRIKAFKKHHEWFIPIVEAMKWMSGRDDTPAWARSLIDQVFVL